MWRRDHVREFRHLAGSAGPRLIRILDIVVAAALLLLLAPFILVLSLAIVIESRGPAFYRCRRVGLGGREFRMLKFRKMHDGAAGLALTARHDTRFTRLGRLLAGSKLDEIPQLFNVLKGDMSLVGPRPEDPVFVDLDSEAWTEALRVRPGITGLSQLAFAKESKILDESDRVGHYVRTILPQKLDLDRLYVQCYSVSMDLKILWWTAAAVLFRTDVAVHRGTGNLSQRRRPHPSPALERTS